MPYLADSIPSTSEASIPKPIFHNIARLAGVGTATVERVLNGRGGVRRELAEKVIAAARTLDYPRRLPDVHRGIFRIDVILVRPETTFFSRLSQAFSRIAATLDVSVAVHRTFMDEHDPAAIAERIANPETRRAGLILAVPDHPLIRSALAKLEKEGLPVLQIVTRAEGVRADYVGIDDYAAGRTAGLLLSRMQPSKGTIVALCHSQIYQVHRDRIRGFSDYLAERPRDGLALPPSCSAMTMPGIVPTGCSRHCVSGLISSASTTRAVPTLRCRPCCASRRAVGTSSLSAMNSPNAARQPCGKASCQLSSIRLRRRKRAARST